MASPESHRDPFALAGQTIEGKYRVAAPVGDGGFGVVYRGVHTGFGELIAIKCLKVPATLDDAARSDFLEQIRDEGRLLHRLSRRTSGIVQALDVGAFTTEAGTWVPYLVLEWLEGETLAELLKARWDAGEGGMEASEALDLMAPAARALAVAHAEKVAHRDVKPANLFVTGPPDARTMKVLDFGIAKVFTQSASLTAALSATANAPSAFTPRYGAPEQFNKQRGATGPWTDVFALALIFVEVVTGKKALDGDDPTQLYISSADPAVRPTLRGRGLDASDPIERVLGRALHIEPKNRYPDAGAFWDDLEIAVRQSPAAETGRGAGGEPSQEAIEASSALTTAEFTEAQELDVKVEAAPPKGDALGPTVPVESLRKSPEKSPLKAPAASSTEADPMAETPVPQRPTPKVAPAASPPEKLAASEPAPPGKRGAGVWPFLLVAIGLGAVTGGYVLYAEGPAPVRPAPSASAPPRPVAPAPPRASATASAMASASAAPLPSDLPPPPIVPIALPADMVRIAPATFRMGEGDAARDVTITRAFFLDRTEVTVRSYLECIAQRKCSAADHVSLPPQNGARGGDDAERFIETWTRRCNESRDALDNPINCVDFFNAESYCRFRGRRLPTEAEWELAARGAASRAYPWGADEPTCAAACYDKNAGCFAAGEEVATCAVGARATDTSPEGAVDLAGNVSEWVADGFVSPLPGGSDPMGDPGSPSRVVRGGSFNDPAASLLASTRSAVAPVTAHATIGLRCAMDAEQRPVVVP